MENPTAKTHPLILAAATAVIVASLAAIAAIFGWLPVKPDAPAAIVAAPAAPEKTAALDTPPPAPPVTAPEERPAARPPAARSAPRPAPAREPLPAYSPRSAPAAANYPIVDNGAYAENERPQPRYSNNCPDCGTVESVREITQEGQGSGIGAVAGGVLGGVLGHQIGGGRGRDVATVAGALGGAYAGNEVEKSRRSSHHYQITVRMDNGTTQTLTETQPPMWRSGDRVRVGNGRIVGL